MAASEDTLQNSSSKSRKFQEKYLRRSSVIVKPLALSFTLIFTYHSEIDDFMKLIMIL